MSINSVILVDRKSEMASDGSKKLYRTYQIETTDPENDDEVVVLTASAGGLAVPRKYDDHPTDGTMWCDTVTCSPFEDRVHWRAEVSYVRKPGGDQSVQGGSNDPWDMPAQVSYSIQKEQIALRSSYQTGDVRGAPTKPVVNSAGDPYNDPAMIDVAHLVIRIQRNEMNGNFNPNTLANYVDTLNDTTITIGGVTLTTHQGRIVNIAPTPAYTQDGEMYWQVTYEILVDRDNSTDPHSFMILDQGFHKLSGTSKIDILDNNGVAVKVAQKLDGAGQPKAFNDHTGHYDNFQGYWSSDSPDWFALKLPKTKQGTGHDNR